MDFVSSEIVNSILGHTEPAAYMYYVRRKGKDNGMVEFREFAAIEYNPDNDPDSDKYNITITDKVPLYYHPKIN